MRFSGVQSDERSLSRRLAAAVMSLVDEGDLSVGDPLPSVTHLAATLGVTVPTMREALRRLETTGSITMRHGSGMYVGPGAGRSVIPNPNSPSRLQASMTHLVRARLAIEPQLAFLAAGNRTADDLRQLASSVRNAERVDGEGVHGNFHRDVARATGNPLLFEVLDSLLTVFRAPQALLRTAAVHGGRDAAEHAGILDAIALQDAAGASSLMTSHLEGLVSLAGDEAQ